MKNKEKEIVVLPDDLVAAEYRKNIEGWVCRQGFFHGKNGESRARRSGATHIKCAVCGSINKKDHYCETCTNKRAYDRYAAKEYKEWNGTDMLYSEVHDRFFSDLDDIECFVEDLDPEERDGSSLKLVICVPKYLSPIDYDHWQDVMPDNGNGELPKEIEAKLKDLNEALKQQAPVSWAPGKFKTSVDLSN